MNLEIKNYYIKYFELRNKDPVLLFNYQIFNEYYKNCHENKKNCIIFPFQSLYSTLIWLGSIQYVGTIIHNENMPYLYDLLNNLTNISPYFEYAYYFGSLIIPIHNDNVEKIKREKSYMQAINLGEKGIYYLCDKEKIKEIVKLKLDDFYKNLNNIKYFQPCISYLIPSQHAFVYWFYLKNYDKAIDNYKIASFHENIPKAIPSLVAVMYGRSTRHLESAFLWFNQYQISIKQAKEEYLGKKAIEHLKNALFEYQLHIISKSDTPECNKNYYCLEEKGYIKNKVLDEIKSCQNINIPNVDNIETIDQVRCYLLYIGIKKGIIGDKLICEKFENCEFYYNENLQDWRAKLKL